MTSLLSSDGRDAVSPRRDHRGILFAERMRRKVYFRRIAPDERLRHLVEHYWLVDWDLGEPLEQTVLAHPCVNIVWQDDDPAVVVGLDRGASTRVLSGVGRVLGVQLRPAALAAFLPGQPPLVDRTIPAAETLRLPGQLPVDTDETRAGLVDAALLAVAPERVDPEIAGVMAMAWRIRHDRGMRRVADLAEAFGTSARTVQRRFAAHIGASPRWVIRRYRVLDAIEHADHAARWPDLAVRLGYSDQAHLIRDFTAATGLSPGTYARRRADE